VPSRDFAGSRYSGVAYERGLLGREKAKLFVRLEREAIGVARQRASARSAAPLCEKMPFIFAFRLK
jgi:hypothetical protein